MFSAVLYQKQRIPVEKARKKTKKPRAKQRDLNKLSEIFTLIPIQTIEIVYENNDQNYEQASRCLSEMYQDSQPKSFKFLTEMFDSYDREYIREVYEKCDANIEKATAFLLEVSIPKEETKDSETEFGNEEIGFVETSALNKRMNSTIFEIIKEIFPTIQDRKIRDTITRFNGDILAVVHELEKECPQISFPDEPEPVIATRQSRQPINLEQDFPSLGGPAMPTYSLPASVAWGKRNHRLDRPNCLLNPTVQTLMNSFPEIEDVELIEDVLQHADGDLTFAHVLMQEMASVYRPLEQSVQAHKQITSSPSKGVSKELRQASPETSVPLPKLTRMDSDRFRDMQNEMNRDMKLTAFYFRFASQAAASGDFSRAKNLSTEGKRYATNSSKIYSQIYLEIFRRQNPNIESYQSIDLHGLHVKEALELTEAYLHKARAQGSRRYEIITGKGLHSEGKAKIKPAVGEFLKEKGYKFSDLEGGYQVKLS